VRVPIIKTPTIYLEELGVWVKLENLQYTGSTKVRPAYFMIMDAMRKGILKEGDTFIESSSGNTAIAMAHLAPMLGLKFKVVLSESASEERKKILRYLGADVIEAPQKKVIDVAQAIADEEGYYFIGQHENPMNPISHEMTTGPEALADLPDVPDCIALGVGTGGTITGLMHFFRRLKDDVYVAGVRPEAEVSVLEGISRKYLPVYDFKGVNDEIIVSSGEALEFHKYLAKKYGLFLGYTSAANILVSHRLKIERKCDIVFTIAPDGGDRYVSKL